MSERWNVYLEKNCIACVLVPANATLPSAKKIIRWKLSKIVELGWCIVHKTVWLRNAKEIMCDTRILAECASNPVVGSSRNSISGSVNSWKENRKFTQSLLKTRITRGYAPQWRRQVFSFLHLTESYHCHRHRCEYQIYQSDRRLSANDWSWDECPRNEFSRLISFWPDKDC